MRPQGLAIALLNLAVWLRLDSAGAIEAARIAVGPGGPVPRRARAAERELEGRRLDPGTLAAAGQALHTEVQLRTSRHRASAEYRRHLLQPLFEQVVQAARSEATGYPMGAQERAHA
jgi:carbon-monoxide dehydrogenase medium subunit